MKNALNNQVDMLGDMFLWLVANLKQEIIYFIKQACGMFDSLDSPKKKRKINVDFTEKKIVKSIK